MDTGMHIIPGVTDKFSMSGVEVYEVKESEQWRLPVVYSLLEVRNDQWEIRFYDGDDHNYYDMTEDDDIEDMLYDVCTS